MPLSAYVQSAIFLILAVFVHWIAAGLDRGRFHWSDNVPAWLQAVGLIALAASYALCFWAMLVNRFFSSVVRIQSDRGQARRRGRSLRLCAAPRLSRRNRHHPRQRPGARFVARHGASLPFLLYRVITEDRVLQAELAGYADYARRVRWRLLPGIW
jgi:protein-S-isoprenylcysteine O-methyltransferase Ste14